VLVLSTAHPRYCRHSFSQYLLNQPNGCKTIRDMIADAGQVDGRGDGRHAQELALTLQGFVSSHPADGELPLGY
jgi:hypothetical protein